MRLLADVKITVQRWCEQLGATLRHILTDLCSTLQSPQLDALSADERQQIHEQGLLLESDLKALIRELMMYEGQTEDLATLCDLPVEAGGRFRNLTQDLGCLKVQVERIQLKVQILQQVLQSLQLTSAEELLFAALSRSNEPIEMADLRQMAAELTDTDFWQALQGLHGKRRLRLHCERIAGGISS
ncbi:MAG: hypothetical protein MI924_03350 [Chloroflexales bacterium]|nr:hypothetical protein [Chloroflexales bacterium]